MTENNKAQGAPQSPPKAKTLQATFSWSFLLPKYWLLWMGLGFAWLIAQLPYRVLLALGRAVGRLFMRLGKRRRHIAQTNFRLCFPDMSETQRELLLKRNFESMGISLFEVCMAWWWSKRRLYNLVRVEGMEHVEAVKDQGILLTSMHFSTLELGGAFLGHLLNIDCMYRPHSNPVFDFVQQRGRQRHNACGLTIPRDEVKTMLKSLRDGRKVWYAPDQDYGNKQSVFAPLFGIQACTVTGTSKFARLGKARVVTCVQERLADGSGYVLRFAPAWEDFPTKDEQADACRVNAWVESEIMQQREQYMWLHRRFKTRPEGEAGFY